MPRGGTMSSVKRILAVIALVPLLAACTSFTAGESASCVSPYIDDQGLRGTFGAPTATASAGDNLTLYGHWYTSTCNDTNQGNGDPAPLPPVRLTLTLPDKTVHNLGSFTPAGADVGFHVVVHLPRTAVPGTASITDDREPPAVYHFTIDPS